MAYNTSVPKVEYIASSSQTLFHFGFKIFVDSDIKVYLTKAGAVANDANDLLILNNDYSVLINGDVGGTVTLSIFADNGDAITLQRSLPNNRDIEYQTSGDLLASTLNTDQEYQTYLIADLLSLYGATFTIPNSAQGVDTEFPAPLSLAYIRWNKDANKLENAFFEEGLASFESQAEALTSASYAIEPFGVNVKEWYSNGDGTFSFNPTANFSSLHYSLVSESSGGGSTTILVTGSNEAILLGSATTEVAMDIREYHVTVGGTTDYEVKFKDNKINVSINGIILTNYAADCSDEDYTLTLQGIKLTQGATVGDVVKVQGFGVQGLINGVLYPSNVLHPRNDLFPVESACTGNPPLVTCLYPSDTLEPSNTLEPRLCAR